MPEDAAQVSERIVRAFNEPFLIGGHKIATTVSIGISVYPLHGSDINALLKRADFAMYQAKYLGKNRFLFFVEDDRPPKSPLIAAGPSLKEA